MSTDNFDDLDLDGIDDLDLDMSDPFEGLKKKSSLKAFSSGLVSGAARSFKSPGLYAKFLKKSLPKSFNRAIDNSDHIKFGLSSSYNKMLDTYKDDFSELKSLLPEGMFSSDSEESDYSWEDDKTLEENTFEGINAQLEQNLSIANSKLKRDNSVDKLKIQGQTLQINQLSGINDRLSAGIKTNNLGLKISHKILEVGFKHYNLALKSHELMHNSSKTTQRALADIIRNTSMPDSYKLEGRSSGRGFGKKVLSRFSGKLGGNLQSRMIDLVTTKFGMYSPMISQLGMLKQNSDLINPWEMLGEFAADIGIEMGSDFLSDKLSNRLSQSNKGNRYGKLLGSGTKNLSSRARYLASTKRFNTKNEHGIDDPTSIKGRLNSALDDFSSLFVNDYDKEASTYSKSYKESASNTIQTNKSLTHVIPGYLARILREVTVANTGDQNTGLIRYSVDRDNFVADSSVKKDVIRKVSKAKISSNTAELGELSDIIDVDNRLSPEAKKALTIQLMHSGSQGYSFYDKNMTDRSFYHEDIGKKERAELIRYFRNYDYDSERLQDVNELAVDKTAAIQESLDSFYMVLDEEINKGNLEDLVAMGLIKRSIDGTISYNDYVIYDYLTSKDAEKKSVGKLLLKAANSANKTTASNRKPIGKRGGIVNTPAINSKSTVFPSVVSQHKNVVSESVPIKEDRLTDHETRDHRNLLISTLNGIKEYTQAIEKNTKEIQVYVGEEYTEGSAIAKRGPGGKELWIPGLNSMRRLGRSGVGLLTSGMDMYGKLLGGAGSLGASFLKGSGNMLLDGMNSLTNVAKVKDVYLKGREAKLPVLLSRDLKAGIYFDQETKKPIKRLRDIKNTIVDKDGNVVISKHEIPNLYTLDGKGIVGRITSTIAKTALFTLQPGYHATKLLAGTAKAITQGINRPKDIYVAGENEPRILSIGLKSGIYFSAVTGKRIKNVNDIDGPVKDYENNIVLTLDDIKKGLVGSNGKPIVSLRYRMARYAAKTVLAPVKLAWNVSTGIVKFGFKSLLKIGSIGKEAYRRLRGKKSKLTTQDQVIMSETNTILGAIYGLLDDRLPSKKVAFNDRDGDGYRDGSFLDKDDDSANDPTYKDDKSLFSKIATAGGLSSLLSRSKKEDDEDGDTYMGVDASGDKESKDKKKRNKKPKSKLGRFWGKSKALASKIPGSRYAGTVARAGIGIAGGMAASSLAGMGGITAMGVLGGIGSGLAAVGTAIAGAISAPFVLGALAVAGVGVGAYMGYKHLTGKAFDNSLLFKMRLYQYGVNPDNKEQVSTIRKLESLLENKVSYGDGTGSINASDKDISKIVEMFNIDPNDSVSVGRWSNWFNERFKPIFMTYTVSIPSINTRAKLSNADEVMTNGEKVRLAEYINFSSANHGPLAVRAGPFGLASVVSGQEAIAMREKYIAELSDKATKEASPTTNKRRGGRSRLAKSTAVVQTSIASSEFVPKPYQGSVRLRGGRSKVTPISSKMSGMRIAANSGTWISPVEGSISSPFGSRVDPFTGKRVSHGGLDYAAAKGTPIYSTEAGTVVRQEYSSSYGNVIYINHADNKQSRYAHMSEFSSNIQLGDWVEKGSLIGYVGNTGRSKGDHLHFEIVDLKRNGNKLDPLKYINDDVSKVAKKELSLTEKEIAKESKFDNGIEGVSTLGGKVGRKVENDGDSRLAKSSEVLSKLNILEGANREAAKRTEDLYERRAREQSVDFKNSMQKTIVILESTLVESRISNEHLKNLNLQMGGLSKKFENIKAYQVPSVASVPKVSKTPDAGIDMDMLPVSNKKTLS